MFRVARLEGRGEIILTVGTSIIKWGIGDQAQAFNSLSELP